MLPSTNMSGTSITPKEDYKDYEYTAQILREDFDKDEGYILRFQQFAKTAGITLDILFLGLKDSKPFTENQNGYTDAQKAQGRALLKRLVEQQFSKAIPSDKPTYKVFAGPPFSGKTFRLCKQFGVDVAAGKFAPNTIIIGPDLVVMAQIYPYVEACKLPMGEARALAMQKAHLENRDESNAFASFKFVKAAIEGFDIGHDSTFTAEGSPKITAALSKLGFRRIADIHLAPLAARLGAREHRKEQNGGFDYVTAADAVKKAVAAYERLAYGSYKGQFEEMSVYVQEPEFYLGKVEAIEVARLDSSTGKMHILPGGQKHLDSILQQARDLEGLKPELLTALEKEFNSWEKAPEVREIAASRQAFVV